MNTKGRSHLIELRKEGKLILSGCSRGEMCVYGLDWASSGYGLATGFFKQSDESPDCMKAAKTLLPFGILLLSPRVFESFLQLLPPLNDGKVSNSSVSVVNVLWAGRTGFDSQQCHIIETYSGAHKASYLMDTRLLLSWLKRTERGVGCSLRFKVALLGVNVA
jgi:hypothetical protein